MPRWDGRERRKDSGDRLIIELPQGSNLDKVARLFITTLGGGLQAVALALSSPQDNSQQVQAQIDELTKNLRASSDKVEGAIDQDKGD